MAGLVDTVVKNYNYVIHELADPRTQEWWGVSSPFVVFSIAAAYLYFCKYLGPKLMQNRPPFELKTVLLAYNIFQVLFSIFLVREGLWFILSKEYNLACEPVDFSYSPRALRIAAAAWFYYAAKITELLDTVFFVLRKKYNQVSFLHVYHHTLMSLAVWYAVKYYPGGHVILMGTLNSMVHVLMYTYYLISSFGPEYQKYVWWKKHVTMIQLIQFTIVLIHNFAPLFYECGYPKFLHIVCCFNAIAFLYMFGNFYLKSYNAPKDKVKIEAKNGTTITANVTRRKVAEKSR